MVGTVTKCALCTTVGAGEITILLRIGWRGRKDHDDYICPECHALTNEPTVPSIPILAGIPTGMPSS